MENPYLQYFVGLKEFQDDAPFDPSLMVHFRKRLGLEIMQEINELICIGKQETDLLRMIQTTTTMMTVTIVQVKVD